MAYREDDIASMARGIVRCRKCPLHVSRTHAVPGEGNASAEVMLVGEAPGEKEDLLGRPFIGRTGQFFSRFLQQEGLDRQELFITSAVKCRPPGNRNPQDGELSTCRDAWLDKQIRAVNPVLVVLLGKIVLRQVFGEASSLADIHGTVREKDGRRFLITYHPTAGMRFPDVGARMREDFGRVRAIVQKQR